MVVDSGHQTSFGLTNILQPTVWACYAVNQVLTLTAAIENAFEFSVCTSAVNKARSVYTWAMFAPVCGFTGRVVLYQYLRTWR